MVLSSNSHFLLDFLPFLLRILLATVQQKVQMQDRETRENPHVGILSLLLQKNQISTFMSLTLQIIGSVLPVNIRKSFLSPSLKFNDFMLNGVVSNQCELILGSRSWRHVKCQLAVVLFANTQTWAFPAPESRDKTTKR